MLKGFTVLKPIGDNQRCQLPPAKAGGL